MVPPKPVLTKETKTYLNCRRVSSSSNEVSSLVSRSSNELSSSLSRSSSEVSSSASIQGTSTVGENNIGAP